MGRDPVQSNQIATLTCSLQGRPQVHRPRVTIILGLCRVPPARLSALKPRPSPPPLLAVHPIHAATPPSPLPPPPLGWWSWGKGRGTRGLPFRPPLPVYCKSTIVGNTPSLPSLHTSPCLCQPGWLLVRWPGHARESTRGTSARCSTQPNQLPHELFSAWLRPSPFSFFF